MKEEKRLTLEQVGKALGFINFIKQIISNIGFGAELHSQLPVIIEEIITKGKRLRTGITEMHLTRHVYLQRSDIAHNKINLRTVSKFSRADRPLSYYFAHEMTHVLQSYYIGKLSFEKIPVWLREGYADLNVC